MVRVKRLAQVRALQALDEAGLPKPTTLVPASSVTNEVWLADDLVVRINRKVNGRLRVLHSTSTPPGLMPLDAPQLLEAGGVAPVLPLMRALDRLRGVPRVENRFVDSIEALVNELATTILPFRDARLVHGDLTFENVLWDGQQITAVLDFEWSRGAPADVELDVLLRMCAFPFLHVAADYEAQTRSADYLDVPRWLADDIPELFSTPRLFERLTLYAIA